MVSICAIGWLLGLILKLMANAKVFKVLLIAEL